MRKAIIGDYRNESHYKDMCHEINRYDDLFDYGITIHDNALCEAAMKARDEAQKEFDERVMEGIRNGIIID